MLGRHCQFPFIVYTDNDRELTVPKVLVRELTSIYSCHNIQLCALTWRFILVSANMYVLIDDNHKRFNKNESFIIIIEIWIMITSIMRIQWKICSNKINKKCTFPLKISKWHRHWCSKLNKVHRKTEVKVKRRWYPASIFMIENNNMLNKTKTSFQIINFSHVILMQHF